MTSETVKQETSGNNVKSQIVSWIKGELVNYEYAVSHPHHPRTCEWLFRHPEFRTWIESRRSTCLVLSAPPGAGKTFSASAVAKYLQDRDLRATSFHFSFNDPSKRTVFTALRAFNLDLLGFHNTVPDAVQQLYEIDIRSGSTHLGDLGIAAQVFKELIKQINRVHIVLDGLDECRDRKSLLPTLDMLLETSTYGIVKWFITTRSERGIRQHVLRHDVLEIEAPANSIKSDIKTFLHDNCTSARWLHLINDVVDKSEGNFLWANSMLRVLNDGVSTGEKDILEELEKFPPGLNGLYIRALHRLSMRRTWQQELARKMFTYLVASFQPLRLSEVSHALAVVPSSTSYQLPQDLPDPSLLEDLCSGLVVFDRSLPGYSKDPLLRFTHKSVHDFFLPSLGSLERRMLKASTDDASQGVKEDHHRKKMRPPFVNLCKSMGAPKAVALFFTSSEDANWELGKVCLQYLSNPRYNEPSFSKALLDDKDHPFLKYAAVFWHTHLSLSEPTPKIYHQVETFMESSAFWNCVAIQSFVAPHLYAVYHRKHKTLRYRSSIASTPFGSSSTEIYYGSPLPKWLRTSRAVDFDGFVTQWYRVLNSSPGDLSQCYMDDQWRSRWPNVPLWLSNHVQCQTVVSRNMTLMDLIGTGIRKTQQEPRVNNGLGSIRICGNSSFDNPAQHSFHFGDSGQFPSPRCPKCLTTFPRQLAMDAKFASDSDFGSPGSALDMMLFPPQWSIVTYTSNLDTTQGLPEFTPPAVSVQWRTDSVDDRKNDSVLAPFELKSHSESGSDSDTDSESDSDSNASSLCDGSPLGSESRSTHKNCLLIIRENCEPITYLWRSSCRDIITRATFHPLKPWIYWSPAAHELFLADTMTGDIQKATLPEPPDIDFQSTMSLHKELHYASEGGDRLMYLVLAIQPWGKGMQCSLSVSSLQMVHQRNLPLEIFAPDPSSTLSFFVDEVFQPPLILTAWRPDYLYVALPPLSCNPKIVRLPLQPRNKHISDPLGFQTLREPILFPCSTPFRQPRLSVDEKGKISLTLSAQSFSTKRSEDTTTMIGPCEKDAAYDIEQGPVLISWLLDHLTSWRDWKSSMDGHSEKYNSQKDEAGWLRGSYVNPDQAFNVTIRSGLDYRTKKVITCS